MEEVLKYLINHYALYLILVMGLLTAIIYGILTVLKKPIKKATAKIKNEKLRKLANKVIILLSFVLAVALWYVLNAISTKYFPIDGVVILLTGAIPVIIYALAEGVITQNQAKAVIGKVSDIISDDKVTIKEAGEIMSDLSDAVSSESKEKIANAENKLNNLLQ
uniref:Uncharacterized protein n=1 Tax=Siphoviridae sp. ctnMR5 TaxID=2825658 RepID=A0A8S5U8V8_9CAUD|nr:MAG TPA: hypothetical protein [Siphoviridae sp. ctnMR5]